MWRAGAFGANSMPPRRLPPRLPGRGLPPRLPGWLGGRLGGGLPAAHSQSCDPMLPLRFMLARSAAALSWAGPRSPSEVRSGPGDDGQAGTLNIWPPCWLAPRDGCWLPATQVHKSLPTLLDLVISPPNWLPPCWLPARLREGDAVIHCHIWLPMLPLRFMSDIAPSACLSRISALSRATSALMSGPGGKFCPCGPGAKFCPPCALLSGVSMPPVQFHNDEPKLPELRLIAREGTTCRQKAQESVSSICVS